VKPGGTKKNLFDTGSYYATHLAPVGSLVLGSTENFGFFTFAPDGSNPLGYGSPLGAISSFASEGATVGGVATDGASVRYQRYDVTANPSGAAVTLAAGGADSIWIGSGGGLSLAVWSRGNSLYAGGVTAAGDSAGAAWPVSGNVSGPAVAITYARGHFGIAWSTNTSATASQASFVIADPSGPVGAPVPLVAGNVNFSINAITATPSGFALLAVSGGDDHAYVLTLDANGHPQLPAHRLLGADQPWSIAAFGNELGVAVSGNDITAVPGTEDGPRPPMFRPLDATGHVTGPWVCLDDPVPKNQFQDMAIMSDKNGYSFVYLAPNRALVLARFDHLGTGAP
jgi:hypothetical protein